MPHFRRYQGNDSLTIYTIALHTDILIRLSISREWSSTELILWLLFPPHLLLSNVGSLKTSDHFVYYTPSFPEIICLTLWIFDKFLFARSWIIKSLKVPISWFSLAGCLRCCIMSCCLLLNLISSGSCFGWVVGGPLLSPTAHRRRCWNVMMSACALLPALPSLSVRASTILQEE